MCLYAEYLPGTTRENKIKHYSLPQAALMPHSYSLLCIELTYPDLSSASASSASPALSADAPNRRHRRSRWVNIEIRTGLHSRKNRYDLSTRAGKRRRWNTQYGTNPNMYEIEPSSYSHRIYRTSISVHCFPAIVSGVRSSSG